ncbi:MAG: dTDP-4-dehydrorhamnose reductase [Eubacteriales bacterium]|nr:dTDP-4-dehydrorhamnose reductase [Eubacteriales bacterium]
MKVLIIGSNGQLGREMQKRLAANHVVFDAYDIPDIDITDIKSINNIISKNDYGTVINCAAYTNVDAAESDYEAAYSINATGPKNIAILCSKYDIELFHVSTDYVFSGEGIKQDGRLRPYIESDETRPSTVYGKTKLAGEEFVMQLCEKSYILRTAWLYGDGNNFVRTMLNMSKKRDEWNVVNDQFGSPTSTADLAEAIFCLMAGGNYGIYHATCEGVCTWYDFAKKIFEIKNIDVKVNPVTSEEFERPAKRPAWSVLENARLKEQNMNVFRHWEDSLFEYLYHLDD